MKRVRHLWRGSVFACGVDPRWNRNLPATRDKRLVTCGRCLRTIRYRSEVGRASEQPLEGGS